MKKQTQLKILLLFLVVAINFNCSTFSSSSKADTMKNVSQLTKANLFVFVGEKISVEEFEQKLEEGEVAMDAGFKAKYKIVERVYGDYSGKTIEFEAYDHYGYPSFAEYKHALLFVSKHKGEYFHQKYQYYDVYKTKSGKWASCGDPYRFDEYHRKNVEIINLNFEEPLYIDLKKYGDESRYSEEFIKEVFVEPYFKVQENKAECLKGSYVDTLFEVKKNGVLKAREVFK